MILYSGCRTWGIMAALHSKEVFCLVLPFYVLEIGNFLYYTNLALNAYLILFFIAHLASI